MSLYCLPVNRLLAALPAEVYQQLVPHLESVDLSVGEVLYEPGESILYVYFPNRAMISLVSIMKDGSTSEIGLVGNEGMLGLPVILGGDFTTSRALVQVAGNAVKLKAEIVRVEFKRGQKFQKQLLLYAQARLTLVSQIAACKTYHSVKTRLARWLLSVQDCVETDELMLTQKFISQMLGVRRASVTEAAIALQKAGLINYTRGQIKIINRQELESTACECYGLIKNEYIRLLNAK